MQAGVVTEQPGVSARGKGAAGGAAGGGGFIKKVLDDDREAEMDANLGAVSSILGDLKMQARAMGDEIDEQNGLIDSIERKAAMNDSRVADANARAAALVRR